VRESLFSHLACAHLTPLLLGSWRKRLDSDVKGESLRSEIRAFLLVLMNERDQATFNVRLQCAFLAAEDLNVQSLQTVFVSTFLQGAQVHRILHQRVSRPRTSVVPGMALLLPRLRRSEHGVRDWLLASEGKSTTALFVVDPLIASFVRRRGTLTANRIAASMRCCLRC